MQHPVAVRVRRLASAILLIVALTPVLAGRAAAQGGDAEFRAFVAALWPQAAGRGVSRATFDRAFAGAALDAEVLGHLRDQPEFRADIWDYLGKRVSDLRIEKGQAKLKEWGPSLAAIEKFYGVDRYVVLAVWGMETNYGGFTGDHSVVQALATLACCSHRQAYFRAELLNALDILQQGHVTPEAMTGSWAGAMGQTQFMPSSFKRFAADGTADGRRDIWTSIPDALASTANYLKENGWTPGESWGYEVVVDPGFTGAGITRKTRLPLGAWQQRFGMERVGGQPFPRPADPAGLLMPAGIHGPLFLTVRNFAAIKRYNNSDSYALAVGHLADRIRGGGPFHTPWPIEDKQLSQSERTEMQVLLASRGYDIGVPDGTIGGQTRTAIKAFQSAKGLSPDGYGSKDLLARLRTAR